MLCCAEPLRRRRHASAAVLAASLAALVLVALAARHGSRAQPTKPLRRLQEDETDAAEYKDVVIVGGGVAGAYTGWRLSSAHYKEDDMSEAASIDLYERTGFDGGRFVSEAIGCTELDKEGWTDDPQQAKRPRTDDPQQAKRPRTELGGMRIRSTDALMLGIVDQLDIEVGPFFMNKNPWRSPIRPDASTGKWDNGNASYKQGTDEPGNPMWCRNVLANRSQYSKWTETNCDSTKNPNCQIPQANVITADCSSRTLPAGVYINQCMPPATEASDLLAASAPSPGPETTWNGILPYVISATKKSEMSKMMKNCAFTESGPACPPEIFASKIKSYCQPCDSSCRINADLTSDADHTNKNGESRFPAIAKWQQSRWGESLNRWTSDTPVDSDHENNELESCMSGYYLDYDWNLAQPENLSPTYFVRPLKGMQELVRRLIDEFKAPGGWRNDRANVHHHRELVSVEYEPKRSSHPYKLTFGETVTSPCSGITSLTGKIFVVRAKRAILALPKAPLERIQYSISPELNLRSTIERLTDSIGGLSLMKTFMAFPERWWEQALPEDVVGGEASSQVDDRYTGSDARWNADFPAGYTVGRFTSSNALGQLFAWYPGTQQTASQTPPECEGKGGVLQIYTTSDPERTFGADPEEQQLESCTASTASQCANCVDPSKFIGDITGERREDETYVPASRTFWERMRVLFEQQFISNMTTVRIPTPTEIKHRVWHADNPVTKTFATHFWRAGIRWWERYSEVLEPVEGLHIVGEAFSLNSGWGEGSLETSEYMLQEKLKLKRPDWLLEEEYCDAMPYYPRRVCGTWLNVCPQCDGTCKQCSTETDPFKWECAA